MLLEMTSSLGSDLANVSIYGPLLSDVKLTIVNDLWDCQFSPTEFESVFQVYHEDITF